MENWGRGGTPPTHMGEETPRKCGPSNKERQHMQVTGTVQLPAMPIFIHSHYMFVVQLDVRCSFECKIQYCY